VTKKEFFLYNLDLGNSVWGLEVSASKIMDLNYSLGTEMMDDSGQ